jgi:hypothetical protein
VPEQFKLCILLGDAPDRPPTEIAPGWEMDGLAYFLRGNQPLEDIALEPEYCLHVHIAGEGGQPGVGDREGLHLSLFHALRDIGYERGISAACPRISTTDGPMDFCHETSVALRYLQDLRARVYAE